MAIWALVCACVVAVCYSRLLISPTWSWQTHWDDQSNFLENHAIHRLSWESISACTTATTLGVHEPMSCVAKVLQVHAFGLESPRPMLLLSLACHVLNSIILFLISVRVLTTNMSRGRAIGCETEGVAACAAGTCVFAVSPARMECVLWASAQPYLLAALFALLAGN